MTFIDRIATVFASVGPFGKLPISGTWGSAVAALAAPFVFMPRAPCPFALLILVLIFIGGGLACDIVEKNLCRKDPGLCVIDEVLGQWTTLSVLLHAHALAALLGLRAVSGVRHPEAPAGCGLPRTGCPEGSA